MYYLISLITPVVVFLNLAIMPAKPVYQIITKPAPVAAKGIYVTAYTAGTKSLREPLIDLIDRTELNAMVIDLKDSSGRVYFDSGVALAKEINAEVNRIPDLKQLIATLKEKNIYLIARIVVFQDPYLAEKKPEWALKSKSGGLWRDWKGLAWVDTTRQEIWQYNADLAKAAAKIGFDEINFDYIRFPSDGAIRQIAFDFKEFPDEKTAKNETVKRFFEFMNKELSFTPVYLSADLFGMTLWRSDGLGIGQRFQDAVATFDYICPMVYPSHYPENFEGFANPADFPYEIVFKSLEKGNPDIKNQRAKFRPWLQDFDLGADYDAAMVRKQIQATYDAGWDSWFIWNASNRYTADAFNIEKK